MKQYPVSLEDLGSVIGGNIVDRHISPGLVNQPVFSAGAVCQNRGEAGEIVGKNKQPLMLEPKIGLCLHWKYLIKSTTKLVKL